MNNTGMKLPEPGCVLNFRPMDRPMFSTIFATLRRARASKINVEIIPFNCSDVFRGENKEKEEKGEKEKKETILEEKNKERGMELSAFGREQLGGKRKGTRFGAGSRERVDSRA